jgi:hypothetical protein
LAATWSGDASAFKRGKRGSGILTTIAEANDEFLQVTATSGASLFSVSEPSSVLRVDRAKSNSHLPAM